jgi:hypothetical protein
MEQNPYESPRGFGYEPPRVRSGWRDFVACVVTALIIFAILEAAGITAAQAYRKSGLDWSRQLRAAGLIFFGTALLVYAAGFARYRWRRRKQVRRLT